MAYTTPIKTYRSIEEQASRLPLYLQEYYKTRRLDRVEIDGNEIHGYFEYSYIETKSYVTEPVRAANGSMGNLDSYPTFLTPRLTIKYNYMHIEDYRKLMLLLRSKNEFTVSMYDIVLDKRVSHKMYFAPPEMPSIHQRNLEILGVKNYTVELIGTNNDVETHTLTYDFNIPSTVQWQYASSISVEVPQNITEIIGEAATYVDTYGDGNAHNITNTTLDGMYFFKKWNTQPDGSGFTYVNGDAYFITSDTTLYAIWG